MEENNKGKFKIKNDEGKEVECEVLFTCELKETGKNYIVYTDNTKDEAGDIKCYASIYDPKGNNDELLPVETDKEWDLLEKVFESIDKKMDDEIASKIKDSEEK